MARRRNANSWFDRMAESPLHQLMATIQQRRDRPSEKSYTSRLLTGGVDTIAAKIREEADELIEAAQQANSPSDNHVIHEAADLLYHMFVLLAQSHVTLDEIETELARRFGVSGLEEKASRKSKSDNEN